MVVFRLKTKQMLALVSNFNYICRENRNIRLFSFYNYVPAHVKDRQMTKEERHALIMDRLAKQGSIMVSDLVRAMNVSSVTIRKDLTELEKQDKLYRSHGKAILMNPYIHNRSVIEKEQLAVDEKRAIGLAAAQLITRDDSIIIASGSTGHATARNIKPIHRLTVVTASLPVSEILAQNESIDVMQLGGMLRHSSLSVVGQYSETILRDCSVSKLYMGVDGIDFEFGFTTTDMREAELNQKMMAAAQKTIILADSSKFGKRGFAKIGNMEDIDIIITDAGISPQDARAIEEIGIDLIIAK